MATLTISDASRLCRCPRSTLQRAVRAGRLHLDIEHRLDPDELTRAGYLQGPGAQQGDAPGAQRARLHPIALDGLLRDMQRAMERLSDTMEVLTQELRQMHLQRSRSALQASDQTLQAARLERPPAALQPRSLEPEALLTQIQRWQAEGMSLRAIAAKLNAEGIPTRSGQGKWYQSNLSRLLAWTATRHAPDGG
jgi:Recombinase